MSDPEKSQHGHHHKKSSVGEVPCDVERSTKRQKIVMKLYDITAIANKRGGEKFYRDRFYVWRRINHRDDPSQSLTDKTNSWRTFVRLENENKMDSLLKRVHLNTRWGSNYRRTTDRSSVDEVDTTGRSRSREQHRECQQKASESVPRYQHSANSRVNEPDESPGFSAASSVVESDGFHDQRSIQPPIDDLHETRSPEVELNAKTIERLWKWERAHCKQIEDLRQRYLDLLTRYEILESRSDEQRLKHDNLAKDAAHSSDWKSHVQELHADIENLRNRGKTRDLNHARLLDAVNEAGLILNNLRDDFGKRLRDLEFIKNEFYDILQRLDAERESQKQKLSVLREHVNELRVQVYVLQEQVKRLQKTK